MDNFIARQPIFNTKNEVIAYELLFRNGNLNYFVGIDGDDATRNVISNAFYSFGIKNIINEKKAFINFTENLIKEEIATILPSDYLVIEILEDVEPTREVINACKVLKEKGYTLALDDFVFHSKYEELIKLADIIKIDFSITKGKERKTIVENLKSNNKIKFLAEKVETIEEYNEALSYGYEYFQGYYFSKPRIISSKAINSNKYITLQILDKINKNEIDFDEIEKLILKDVGLSYKLLKLINSASLGVRNKTNSIMYALTILGEKELIKWLYVVLLNEMKQSSPEELINLGLIRAKFCESISENSKLEDKGILAYITGMFSVMDAILGVTIESVVTELYLPDEVKDALISKNNSLSDILTLVISYEKGDWDKVLELAKELSIDPDVIAQNYFDSLEWVKSII